MRFFHHFLLRGFGLLLAFALTSGCFSPPRLVTLIHEGDNGTVFLKEFHDSFPRASHPVTLESQLIRRIFLGVRIHERQAMIESAPTGDAGGTPAFTLAEADFLTPAFVYAFNQATPQEAVHFQIKRDVSGKRFDTGGSMFIKGETLNFSLTEYGPTPQRSGTLSQPTSSFDRPNRWSVTFTPSSAVLNAEEDKQSIADENVPKPLLISLKALKQYVESVPKEEFNSSQSPEAGIEGQSQEELDQEIEQLRKSMKEQED